MNSTPPSPDSDHGVEGVAAPAAHSDDLDVGLLDPRSSSNSSSSWLVIGTDFEQVDGSAPLVSLRFFRLLRADWRSRLPSLPPPGALDPSAIIARRM